MNRAGTAGAPSPTVNDGKEAVMFKSWLKLAVLLVALTVLYLDLRYAAHTPEYAAPSVFDGAKPPEYDVL